MRLLSPTSTVTMGARDPFPIPLTLLSCLHLVICEFVSVGITDFANTKSMGKVNI